MNPDASTLKELFNQRAKENPRDSLLIFGGRQWSYAEFASEVNRVAHGLLRLGIQRGDKIALLLPNCPEFLFFVFASGAIGAVFVPVNTEFTPEEAQYVLHHSGSTLLITTGRFHPLVNQIRGKCPDLKQIISLQGNKEPEVLDWEEFLFGASDGDLGMPIKADEIASITYTSGTTDRPKGVLLTHGAYLFAPQKRAEWLGWSPKDRVLVMLPLFHVNALCHMAIAIISVGGSILLRERFSASRFWDDVRENGVTTSSLMRTIPHILLNLPEKPDDASNPLRLAVALLAPETHLRFEERFRLTVIPSYSLTEDILSVLGPLDPSKRKLGSCGLPIAPEVHRLVISNEKGESLPQGQLGEIVKQSPAVMKGYYKNPEATTGALKNGWLHTGDLGYLDQDGFLYFVDRKKDMVKRGDENISSEEVESVLNRHPIIAESAVVGVPDPIRQEEVKAYIVLKHSARAEQVDPIAIWDFCREHLAAFKVPRYLEILEKLPKTPSSKIQKNLLRGGPKGPSLASFDRLAAGKKEE